MKHDVIGKVGGRIKIAAGLFWADYSCLGAQVRELEQAGVDWLHLEVRDGAYMHFGMPRGGFDVIEATRKSTELEIEAQLQMVRPTFDTFKQMADLGVNMITLPLETMGELTMQAISYITDVLGLKAGVWAWQGTPISAFEQYIQPYVRAVEYESRAYFWARETGTSPHTMDPIMVDNIRRLHEMVRAAGLERQIEVMEDGGLGADNVAQFVAAGMTVGEFSSPLLKGPQGKLQPGTGEIGAAVAAVRRALDAAAASRHAPGNE